MTAPIVFSFNFPYLFDFFYSSRDVTSRRNGRLIDAMLIEGGMALWRGHQHLVVELHALRALSRLCCRVRLTRAQARHGEVA